jgi:hypothetical protein
MLPHSIELAMGGGVLTRLTTAAGSQEPAAGDGNPAMVAARNSSGGLKEQRRTGLGRTMKKPCSIEQGFPSFQA